MIARRIPTVIPDASAWITAEAWPWLALAALGFFHGINPAMGWLFAVALGLHRHSRKIVLMSWVPIALGHSASAAIVVFGVLALGLLLDRTMVSRAAAIVLLGWAVWHGLLGHRQRLRVGMQTGFVGLGLWSFLMATAHGAGLMLVPVLLPLCLSGSPAGALTTNGSLPIAIAALAVHTAVMLATVATISIIVYEWIGLAFLRSGWINFDLIWIVGLGACGALLLFS